MVMIQCRWITRRTYTWTNFQFRPNLMGCRLTLMNSKVLRRVLGDWHLRPKLQQTVKLHSKRSQNYWKTITHQQASQFSRQTIINWIHNRKMIICRPRWKIWLSKTSNSSLWSSCKYGARRLTKSIKLSKGYSQSKAPTQLESTKKSSKASKF